jgi:MFS transporter, ACS family, glucarate transporter
MIDEFSTVPGKGRRTRVRYQVLAFMLAMGAITYLDRLCIAQAASDITRDLGLTTMQLGMVFSAFTIAYALFEIPTGAWGDRIGTRRVLTRIVAWWSTFTILTAAAYNLRSLLAVRFLFGMGEAGAFPNAGRTFSRWFPVVERGRVWGIFFAGVHLGGGLTPLLVVALLRVMSWRTVFVVCGMVGFIWAAAWFWWFRDEPADHLAVSPEERTYIEAGRMADQPHSHHPRVLWRVATDANVLALCMMYFTQAYGFYFNITWLPTYLEQARGFSSTELGFLAGLPLILSSMADVLGGFATDWASRAFGLRIGRCGLGGAALLVAGVSLIVGAAAENAYVSAVSIAMAGAAASFLLPVAWGTCLDIAGPHAGLVTATMNSSGQIGAFLSPIILPIFLRPGSEDWATPLYITGLLYLFGSGCWLLVDPRRKIKAVWDEV